MRISRLIAAGLLLLALGASATILPPYQAVRAVHDADGDVFCSAVVLKPGLAVTARHCVQEQQFLVDGHWVVEAESFYDETKDVALLKVPGLECPCADLGDKPEVGDQVLAVGYPGGEYRISEIGLVALQGPGALPKATGFDNFPPSWAQADYLVVAPNIIYPGNSGGALFARQDGKWVVVGISSLTLADPKSCVPFFGCTVWLYSAFVPVHVVKELLTPVQ